MKKIYILFALLISIPLVAQDSPTVNKRVVKRIKKDVKKLASDKMEGREAGTKGELLARDYLVNRMIELGLEPYGTEGYIQTFPFFDADKKVENQAHNVIGFIDNGSEYTVAIMAHYDHLGYGGVESEYHGSPKIHNGADDNASGAAAVLELANFLKNNKVIEQNNFLFIAFSAEEKGLYGSRYFVQNPTIHIDKINYVLNMDMIGRMEEGMALTIEGVGSSLLWEPSLKAVDCTAFPLTLKKRENGPSDHKAFYYSGIPALHFWTGKHGDYHKPSDDVEKINFEAESQIISFIESLIVLLDSKGKIDFHLRRK